jgi:hypothetical protein
MPDEEKQSTLKQYFTKQLESCILLYFMVEANIDAGIPEPVILKCTSDNLEMHADALEYVRMASGSDLYPVFRIKNVGAWQLLQKL